MSEEKSDKQKHMFMQSGNTFVPEEPLLFSERQSLKYKIESLQSECEEHASMVRDNIEQIKELQGLILEAERRGEERAIALLEQKLVEATGDFRAALEDTIHELQSSDGHASEEYKEGK